jgi:hypothetical protein
MTPKLYVPTTKNIYLPRLEIELVTLGFVWNSLTTNHNLWLSECLFIFVFTLVDRAMNIWDPEQFEMKNQKVLDLVKS